MARSDYFAGRVTHYLKGYRKKSNLTQTELAERLGSTKSTVSRIENGQDKQVNFVLEFLENLGKLEKMDLGDFINYLDSNKVSAKDSTLFPWQRSVLEALLATKQSLRLDFVAEVIGQDKEKLEKNLELMVRFNRLPKSAQQVIENMVTELSRAK